MATLPLRARVLGARLGWLIVVVEEPGELTRVAGCVCGDSSLNSFEKPSDESKFSTKLHLRGEEVFNCGTIAEKYLTTRQS